SATERDGRRLVRRRVAHRVRAARARRRAARPKHHLRVALAERRDARQLEGVRRDGGDVRGRRERGGIHAARTAAASEPRRVLGLVPRELAGERIEIGRGSPALEGFDELASAGMQGTTPSETPDRLLTAAALAARAPLA